MVITVKGLQFSSKDFMDFAKDLGFDKSDKSSYHRQSNGKAEATVKITSCRKQIDTSKTCFMQFWNAETCQTEGRNQTQYKGYSTNKQDVYCQF